MLRNWSEVCNLSPEKPRTFVHTRPAGFLMIAGLILNLILPVTLGGP